MRWFWIDRFTKFECGRAATAIKNVSLAEEHLHDHFDGYPIMPNALILEGMAQTGGLLASEADGFERIVVLGKVSKSTFHFPARPGDTLVYEATIDGVREGGASVAVTSHVGDRLQASAEIFFAHLGEIAANPAKQRLFEPEDIFNWLQVLGAFDVGRNADGTRMTPAKYHFASFAEP